MPETKTKITPIRRYITEFLEYCEIEKNRSQLTIRNYDHYLQRFASFAEAQNVTKPEDITPELVRSFRLHLNRLQSEDGKNLKLVTQQYHVIALRAYLKYLAKRDVPSMAAEKIELGRKPSREIEVMSHDEMVRILAATKTEESEILRIRDYAIILTLFSSGVRISELASLRKQSINFDRGEFTVRGKGDKLRVCFLSDDAIAAIKLYIKKRTDNSPALFVAHSTVGNTVTKEMDAQDAGPNSKNRVPGLSVRSVQRLVEKYRVMAGILHRVSPHTFRHSFATDLLQNGADIRSVQSLLGHASITTTQIYTHVTNEGLRDIHQRFHNKKSPA